MKLDLKKEGRELKNKSGVNEKRGAWRERTWEEEESVGF